MKKIVTAIVVFTAAIAVSIVLATSEILIAPGSVFPVETGQGTPSATCAIDEEAYLTSISRTSYTMSRVATELEGLLTNPRVDSEEWTLEVTTQAAIIREEYEKTIQLLAPDCLLDVHTTFNLGMAKLNEMTCLLAEGIAGTDYDLIEEAYGELHEGAALIAEAVDVMNLSNEVYGI